MKKCMLCICLIILFCCLSGKNSLYANSVFSNMGGSEKTAYLTFDDGPDKANTLQVMNILLEHNVDGTFFFTGVNMKNYPSVVKKVYDNGFTIGLHGYDHSSLAKMGQDSIKQQLKSTNDVLEGITGERSLCIRPPYGAFNKETISTIESLGYYIYMWDIDPRDWAKDVSTDQILNNIKSNLKPGSIILLHSSANQTKAIQILPELITYLKTSGYKIKALPDNGYKTVTAKLSGTALSINDELAHMPLYKIDGSNYIKVRHFAEALNSTANPFNVTWNSQSNMVELTTGINYVNDEGSSKLDENVAAPKSCRANPASALISVNKEQLNIKSYLIGGSNYLNLRELSVAVGVDISYDSELNTALITAKSKLPAVFDPGYTLCFRVLQQVFWKGIAI